jgi:hypothetical protein
MAEEVSFFFHPIFFIFILHTLSAGRSFPSSSSEQDKLLPAERGRQLILQIIKCKCLYISICTIFHEPEYDSAKNSDGLHTG